MRLNRNLIAFVQCNRGQGWDTMAGFDVDRIAIQYAKDCAEGIKGIVKNPGSPVAYRAMGPRGKLLWSSDPAPAVQWLEPCYPGDTVVIARMKRRDELGDIRIQQYRPDLFRVGTFLPGVHVQFPGDTPKVEPEDSGWYHIKLKAEIEFEKMVCKARADGWKEYAPTLVDMNEVGSRRSYDFS